MIDQVKDVYGQALAEIQDAVDGELLEQLRVKYLGKKGEVTSLVKEIRNVAPELRGEFGKQVNEVKQAVAGYGSADKKQVQEMVRVLLQLDSIPKPDDAADALAVAIPHLNTNRY